MLTKFFAIKLDLLLNAMYYASALHFHLYITGRKLRNPCKAPLNHVQKPEIIVVFSLEAEPVTGWPKELCMV
jgi:hypothetical protein